MPFVLLSAVDIVYEEESEFAIQMNFDGFVFFRGGDTPSMEDVYATMANADYNRYLEDFIWEQLEGVFLGVVLVEFGRRA